MELQFSVKTWYHSVRAGPIKPQRGSPTVKKMKTFNKVYTNPTGQRGILGKNLLTQEKPMASSRQLKNFNDESIS